MAEDKPSNGGKSAETVQFHYIKSPSFRVVYADGAMGSITPQGHIYFALYNERVAMPRTTVHAVQAGQLGPIIGAEGRDGFVRELETGVLIDRAAAANLRDWLSDRIKDWDTLQAAKQTKGSA